VKRFKVQGSGFRVQDPTFKGRGATFRVLAALAGVLVSLTVGLTGAGAQKAPRLFAPEELGLLEAPDRDLWQQPEDVMDRLGISEGARVADIGAGGGWFTVRLAKRVGQTGTVYAEDIQPQMIESIARRVKREGLGNVHTILGTAEDPRLPKGLDAVLMVDTYTQLANPVGLLERIAASLAPNGKLGVVDFKRDGAGGPGPALEERVDPETIRKHAEEAGLRLLSHETFLRYQYLLIFSRN
jgi:SAM-dependent methyltransferase